MTVHLNPPCSTYFLLRASAGHVHSRWRTVSSSTLSPQLLQKSFTRRTKSIRLACVPIMQWQQCWVCFFGVYAALPCVFYPTLARSFTMSIISPQVLKGIPKVENSSEDPMLVLLLAKSSALQLPGIYIHTYIHNWPLQPFSQDFGLVPHATHFVCVNFIREWQHLQFNVDSE